MRIAIDFRLLSGGLATMSRGMGRYTQQQLAEVLKLDSSNTYLLVHRRDSDLTVLDRSILRAPNVELAKLPALSQECSEDPNLPRHALRLRERFQNWLTQRNVSLFHATTPFFLGDLVLDQIDAVPVVVTHYDLIPLVYPDRYLGDGPFDLARDAYYRGLRLLRSSTRIVAISQYARSEASTYLGIDPDRIDVAYPFAAPSFRRLSENETESRIAEFRRRHSVEGDFLISVTHFHHSKNLPLLFRCYSVLRQRGVSLPLVVVCNLTQEQFTYVRELAAENGVDRGLVLTGLVSDDELVGLLNRAVIALHVSLYEGFGLPVLEAMQCGTAVVATSRTSLPEVVRNAGVLVDPESPEGLARVVEDLLEDPQRRGQLIRKGLEQAKEFSGPSLGRATLAAYERAAANTRIKRKPRIALWSPLPPQRTGVADYTAELGLCLSESADVDVFVDDGVYPDDVICDSLRVHHSDAFRRILEHHGFDFVVVEFGASFFHLYQFEQLEAIQPDLLVLHDLTWGFIRHAVHSNQGFPGAFHDELKRTEGSAAVREFRRICTFEGEAREEAFESFFAKYWMLSPVIAASDAQLVHLPAAVELLGERQPGSRPIYIPMGVSDPYASRVIGSHRSLRKELGAKQNDLVVGVFGILDPVKRVGALLEAIAGLWKEGVVVHVVLVGDAVTDEYKQSLVQTAARLGVTEAVHFLGHVSRGDFDWTLREVDVVVNLRWPFRLQMSATLARAIAAGKPILISDVPEWGFLPEAFCVRIPPGEREVERLCTELRKLHQEPSLISEMGESARGYFLESGAASRMASAYLEVLEELKPSCSVLADRGKPVQESSPNHPLPTFRIVADSDGRHPQFREALGLFVRDSGELEHRLKTTFFSAQLWWNSAIWQLMSQLGLLSAGGRLAILGAGVQPLTFRATRHFKAVVAIDDYGLDHSEWRAPSTMLDDPASWASSDWACSRLEVETRPPWSTGLEPDVMDAALVLPTPVIRSRDQLVATFAEASRVVRPGGPVISGFRFSLAGTQKQGDGFRLCSFDREDLRLCFAPFSDLELLEPLDDRSVLESWRLPRRFRETDPETPVEVLDGRVTAPAVLAARRTSLDRRPAAEPKSATERETLSIWDEEWRTGPIEAARVDLDETPSSRESPSNRRSALSPLPDPADLNYFFGRWNEVRARSGLSAPATGSLPARLFGFVRRTSQRIRDMGIAWDRLRDLLRALVDRHLALDAYVRGLAHRQVERISDDEHMPPLRARLVALEEEVGRLRDLVEQRREGGASSALSLAAPETDSEGSIPSAREFLTLLSSLEKLIPEVCSKNSIEVSFGTVHAEELLLLAYELFGSRLSCSSPESYRMPNDLWIHFEARGQAPRATLLRSAAPRLCETGLFVLVVEGCMGTRLQVDGLVSFGEHRINVSPTYRPTILAFEKSSPSERSQATAE